MRPPRGSTPSASDGKAHCQPPLGPRPAVLAFERVCEVHPGQAGAAVRLPEEPHARQMIAQSVGGALRRHGRAVLPPFAAADQQVLLAGVDALHAEPQTFGHAQATA